jgi:HSP20 family protein
MKSARKPRSFPSISRLRENDSLLDYALELQRLIARRAYEFFALSGFLPGRALDNWLAAESDLLEPLSFAVTETEEEIRLSAVVEGFNEKEIEVKVNPRRVFITAKRSAQPAKSKGAVSYPKHPPKEIFHEYKAPVEIVPDGVKAEFQDGVLELTLPKRTPGKKARAASNAA